MFLFTKFKKISYVLVLPREKRHKDSETEIESTFELLIIKDSDSIYIK